MTPTKLHREKKVKVEKEITLKKKGEFGFAYYENAQRVAMAFALAHHHISIRQENSTYVVEVYSY